ncbi:ParA family protein [Carnimonas bestiolae]|uniref:ParA family protein n=1 Tax=Carnimonas bestiolae TaxID=3402172 RepID=UPI003EDB9686
MRVIADISTKGGPGKTTLAANLGGLLADAGLRVLLVDLDIQPTLSTYYAYQYDAPGGVYELMATDLVDVDQIVSKTVIDRLDIIRSNDPRDRLSPLLLTSAVGRFRLRGLMERFADSYDVTIIDTQGARSILLENAILASDLVISPTAPELLSAREFVRGTLGMMSELRELGRYARFDVPPVAVVFNKMADRLRDSREIAASMREMFNEEGGDSNVRVLNPVLRMLVAFRTAAQQGVPVHRIDQTSNRKTPSCSDQMKAVAIEIFPEWSEAINAVGTSANTEVHRGLH